MEKKQTDDSAVYSSYQLDLLALARLTLIGLAAGLLGWLLSQGIAHYFIEPVFCRSTEAFTLCRNGGTIAWVIAQVITLAAAVAVMAKFAVYRPLLVVIAVFLALWGLSGWVGGMVWYWSLLWHIVLFMIAFAVFGWLARVSNFAVAVTAMLVTVVLARLVLLAA